MSDAIAGWHGKLPSLGDFASRRLEPDFIALWDGWLAAGLAGLQQQAPSDWLQHYLACPAWRFVLMPGLLPAPFGDRAWAGVLMPSVDRIGRYFPLTLIAPLDEVPPGDDELRTLLSWLHDLDDLAADALQDDWTIDRLEAELALCQRPGFCAHAASADLLPNGVPFVIHPAAGAEAIIARIAEGRSRAWLCAAAGHAFWWADGQSGEPRLLVTHGLPSIDDMRLLFGAASTEP